MTRLHRQRGVALFTAVFLLVAVGVLAASVALMSGQQQLGSAQALDQTRAYYAARARLDEEIANLLINGVACANGPGTQQTTFGFTTVIQNCNDTDVNEGGVDYHVYTIGVAAARGSLAAGTLVRRTVRAQVTDAP